jgi:hypothetical protein
MSDRCLPLSCLLRLLFLLTLATILQAAAALHKIALILNPRYQAQARARAAEAQRRREDALWGRDVQDDVLAEARRGSDLSVDFSAAGMRCVMMVMQGDHEEWVCLQRDA